MVIVGNKLDVQRNPVTVNRSTHLLDRSTPILQEYPVWPLSSFSP